MTTRTTIDGPESPPQTRRSGPKVALVAAIGAAALAAVALILTLWPAGSSAEAAQLVRTQRACQEWADASPGAPADNWCGGMVTWMRQQLSEGALSGPMMWSTPAAMRSACRHWADVRGDATDDNRCDDMVAWMTKHLPASDGWLMPMRGMMGNGPS